MKFKLIILFLLIVLSGCGFYKNDVNVYEVIYRHNKFRAINNLEQLEIDESLMNNSQKWAEIMARKNSMYHSNLSGIPFPYKAENIAMGAGIEEKVVQMWINSSGHKKNMLGKKYTHIGVGYAESSRGSPYWCVQFGG